MAASKLYRDGNVDSFQSYGKATLFSVTAALAVGFVISRFALKADADLQADWLIWLAVVSVPMVLTFLALMWFMKRPLLSLNAGYLTYYTGLLSRDSIETANISSVSMFTDDESICVDLLTKSGFKTRFETRTVADLDVAIREFLSTRLGIPVECVNKAR